ncbi:MAG: zf-HC2 domain-containing protein, partial [Clostridiales bacterium]|nr:zf-HC2 domain-containing protein [Clostridiales bacterium]
MKINCNVAQDLMQPYVEDILSKDSRDLLEEHISECDTCKLRLDEIRSINQELDGKTEAGGKAVLPAY